MFNDDYAYKTTPRNQGAHEIDLQVRYLEKQNALLSHTYLVHEQPHGDTVLHRTALVFRNLITTLFMN